MTETTTNKGQRDRSPAYPAIPLGAAIERLTTFEAHFKRSPARVDKAGSAWGISQSGDILAALKSFGLIDYQGANATREVIITEEGRTYLRAQQEAIKREIIQRVALRPKMIAMMWAEWGPDRPRDDACIDTLVFKHKFSARGAPIFLRVYDATIGYARLTDSSKVERDEDGSDAGSGDDDDTPPPPPPPPASVAGKVKIMEAERVVFTEEGQPNQYLKLIASGDFDATLLEALEDFVKRQRKRLGISEPTTAKPN